MQGFLVKGIGGILLRQKIFLDNGLTIQIILPFLNPNKGFFYFENFFYIDISLSICHLCRLGLFAFFRSRTPHKITHNNKILCHSLTLIPIKYGHYLLNSTHTVVVSYNAVSSTSTISSKTVNMSAPVSTTSNRKSAKFLDIIAHDKVYRIV